MSKQTGLVTFKGKMGNISFFKRKGESHARLSGGGFSKERFAKDPKLKRVRENINEFNALAQTVKSFGRMLSTVSSLKDGTLNNRLTKVFGTINKQSMGIRGQRPVMLSQQREMLLGLEINADQNFVSVCKAPFSLPSTDRNVAITEMPDLQVALLNAPPSATHFRLIQLFGGIADTVYDVNAKKYEPLHPALNGLSRVTYSEYLPLNSGQAIHVSLHTIFPAPDQDIPEDLTLIQALGIEFYDQLGPQYYSLGQNRAMKIVRVL